MNTDVIDLRECRYVHALIDTGGYIKIGGSSFHNVWHRGNTLERFPEAPAFDTLDEAFSNLPEGEENFVLSFPFNDTADRLWFTQTSRDAGIMDRLEMWKACYGGYKTSIYREAVDIA